MKIQLNDRQRKHLVKQSLLLFQLEMWKNELTLRKEFSEFTEEHKIEIPPNLGSAMIVFKTIKIVDENLFALIRGMEVLDALKAVMRKYAVTDTEEDKEEFIIPGQERVIEIPDNIEELIPKIEKGNLKAEDLKENPKIDKSLKKDADYKVEKENILSEPKMKKV